MSSGPRFLADFTEREDCPIPSPSVSIGRGFKSRGVVCAPFGDCTGEDLGYAGDIAPDEAWRLLNEDPSAVLVDVRTEAEWTYIGIPDLSAAGKRTVLVSWLMFPGMEKNPHFASELESQGVTADQTGRVHLSNGQPQWRRGAGDDRAGFWPVPADD